MVFYPQTAFLLAAWHPPETNEGRALLHSTATSNGMEIEMSASETFPRGQPSCRLRPGVASDPFADEMKRKYGTLDEHLVDLDQSRK